MFVAPSFRHLTVSLLVRSCNIVSFVWVQHLPLFTARERYSTVLSVTAGPVIFTGLSSHHASMHMCTCHISQNNKWLLLSLGPEKE